ncbi:MAG: tetrathionate reductase family octaheme c-type cytochrome [Thermodesulfobacteriota bacterium]
MGFALITGLLWIGMHADRTSADVTETPAGKPAPHPSGKALPPETAWKAPDQEAAKERAWETVPFVDTVIDECQLCRQQKLRDKGLSPADIPHKYVLLDSPIINKRENHYEPVRFMHAKHANLLKDCAVCHHYRPTDPAAAETTRCSACHQESFRTDHPERIGLKAAYHIQCIQCHRQMNRGPSDCSGCHPKNVPDHQHLVQLPAKPEPTEVTRECLRCHEQAGEDMLSSVHWLWKGHSPYTMEHRKEVQHGKATTAINNFCIATPSNEPRCTSCHAGYGWKDNTFDFSDKSRIDCLVCHDTTGTYKKAPPAAGMPEPDVDLKHVAENVGHSSRRSCGVCHFNGGGDEAVKHADLSRQLLHPERSCDIHMGGYDLQCSECHQTRNHKISGRSSSAPPAEGALNCTDCHSDQPHYANSLLDHHLNNHCRHIDCNTCHSPLYAKCKPTKVYWDWSRAGDMQRQPKNDKYGMPDYNWMKGEFQWKESAKPTYRWFGGFTKRVLIGDKLDLTSPVIHLTEPVGAITDPGSRIAPFKLMDGIQAADAVHTYLLVPHLFPRNADDTTAYWKNRDWQKAFTDGMKTVGLPYSGSVQWIKTRMFWSVNHEVMPAGMALSCSQCHGSLKEEGRTCNRCHQDNRNVNFREIAHKGTDFSYMAEKGRDVGHLIGSTDYIDFKALGYKGDPIVHGGRFTKLPMGYAGDKK